MGTEYYDQQRLEGEAYEAYVCARLEEEWRIRIERCTDRSTQISHGDTFFGLEIKLDKRFAETGNLCIELAEKTNAKNPRFVPAGIRAESGAWLYGIGNEDEFFIFSKRTLRLLADFIEDRDRQPRYSERDKPNRIRTYETPTSRGFLLPRLRIGEYCEVYFFWGEPVTVHAPEYVEQADL